MYVVLGYKDRLIEPRFANAEDTDNVVQQVADVIFGNETSNAEWGPIPKLWPTATGIGERNIFELVELGQNRIALRCLHPLDAPEGQSSWVITVHPAGDPGWLQLVAGVEPDERCTFHRIDLADDGAVFALRTYDGCFVTAERDGRDWPLVVDRVEIGEWQRFMWVIPPADLLPPAPDVPEPKSVYEQVTEAVGKAKIQDSVRPHRPEKASKIGQALGDDKPLRKDFINPFGG